MSQLPHQQGYDRNGAQGDALPSSKTKRGPLALAVQVYTHTPTTWGFLCFAATTAIALLFLYPPISSGVQEANIGSEVPARATLKSKEPYIEPRSPNHLGHGGNTMDNREHATNTSSHRPADNLTRERRTLGQIVAEPPNDQKSRPKALSLEGMTIDRSLFTTSDPAVGLQLYRSADAFEHRDYKQALSLLDDIDLDDANVLLMRGVVTVALPGAKNRQAGARLLERAAEMDQRQSLKFLGLLMLVGPHGIDRNPEQGRALLERAANLGDAVAARHVGTAYHTGWAGVFDDAKAVKYLRTAVDGGDSKAAYRLSILAMKGAGMEKDIFEARRLARIAAEGGQRDGQATLGMMYLSDYIGGRTNDPRPAIEWLTRAAEAGSGEAMKHLAYFYLEFSRHLKWRDPAKGADYFRRCAAMWNAACMFGYATAFHGGVGVRRDLVKAHAYYSLSLLGKMVLAPKRIDEVEKILTAEQLNAAQAFAEKLKQQRSIAVSLNGG